MTSINLRELKKSLLSGELMHQVQKQYKKPNFFYLIYQHFIHFILTILCLTPFVLKYICSCSFWFVFQKVITVKAIKNQVELTDDVIKRAEFIDEMMKFDITRILCTQTLATSSSDLMM